MDLFRLLVPFALLASVGIADAVANTRPLVDLTLEELGNLKVTSVSKRPERLLEAPASIYVISRDAIRRSGAATLPEVLRLAPNLQVAQVSSAGYAISARGFNGSNTSAPNKMLVMINGRSVYSPLFSGVFWDVQDVMLEDVDRIEVISGPGGTLWGVNAVNAVVNIITLDAAETRGALVSIGAGNPDSDLALRYGAPVGEDGNIRAYAKWINRRHTWTEAGLAVDDAGHKLQVGFRYDLAGSVEGRHFSLAGNAYRGLEGQPEPGLISVEGTTLALGDIDLAGGNLIARWDSPTDGGGSVQWQAYYDRTERTVPPTFSEVLEIVDVQMLHRLAPRGHHDVAWGFNARRSHDRVTNSDIVAFLPAELHQTWLSLYLQDRIGLTEDADLTLGARVERNDYTGYEFLPSLRLAWRMHADAMVWMAASRAVRAPSRLDRDTRLPGVPPYLLDGGPAADSELADVYEIGFRGQPSPRLSWSATVYHASYDRLRTLSLSESGTSLVFGSDMEGHARGFEGWGTFQVTPTWRLGGGLTLLDESLHLKPGGIDVAAPLQTGLDPSVTWQLRSSWDLGDAVEFDVGVRHVGELERNAVPAYTTVDAHLGWRLGPDLEVSLSGQNLNGRHAEYGRVQDRTEDGRRFMLRMVWQP